MYNKGIKAEKGDAIDRLKEIRPVKLKFHVKGLFRFQNELVDRSKQRVNISKRVASQPHII